MLPNVSTRFKVFGCGALALSAIIFQDCRSPARLGSSDLEDVGPSTALFANRMSSRALFNAFSTEGGGVVLGGRSVKFLIDQRTAQPKVYFMNGNYTEGEANSPVPEFAKYHFYFAQKQLTGVPQLTEFNNDTYFTQNKKFVAGTLRTYTFEDREVFGLQLYPQDVATGASIPKFLKIVKGAIAIQGIKLAFVATGQQQGTGGIESQITGLGLLNLTIEKILGTTRYLPLNFGHAYGHLRIFPQDSDDLAPSDIAVFDELPLDLTVVAGVITRAFQDTNSHVNLKSKERNTPNMVLRDAGPAHPDLAQWANKPVHLVITADSFKIEASSEEEVAEKLRVRLDKPWQTMHWTPTPALLNFDEICPSTPAGCLDYASRIGSKAANLGFLANRKVLGRASQTGTKSAKMGYDLTPRGFGIPFHYYAEFVNYPANAGLKSKIQSLVEQEKGGALTGSQRKAMLAEIKAQFFRATFPPQNLAAIQARVVAVLPGIKKLKMRSSANAEDIPGFDGAGLYNSYSVNMEKVDNPDGSCLEVPDDDSAGDLDAKTDMKPKTVNCAVKGVYASLWSKRGVEERSFARLDHQTVAMGVAVVPKYDLDSPVTANSVVVTRVLNARDVYGYMMSIQKDNNLVTNPDAGTWTEVTISAFVNDSEPVSFTTTRFAKPVKDGPVLTGNVMTRANMLKLTDISKAVELAYCRFKPTYYPGDASQCTYGIVDPEKPKSLDMEFKFLANGRFVCKQVREFSGR